MNNNEISVLGAKAWLTADKTYPAGFPITKFPADSDAIDIQEAQIANGEMGVNGDLIKYRTAVPQTLGISVIPGSEEDQNLQILLDRNRASKGRMYEQDNITLVITLVDGTTYTFSNGIIISGELGYSLTSQGKIRTKRYTFMFEQFA